MTCTLIHSTSSIHSMLSNPQIRCLAAEHSMAAHQPALPWDFLHRVNESPANCRSSLISTLVRIIEPFAGQLCQAKVLSMILGQALTDACVCRSDQD